MNDRRQWYTDTERRDYNRHYYRQHRDALVARARERRRRLRAMAALAIGLARAVDDSHPTPPRP